MFCEHTKQGAYINITLMLDALPNTNLFIVQGTGYLYLRHRYLTKGNSINDVAQRATVESIMKGIIIY